MGRKNQRRIECKKCPFCGSSHIDIYESIYGGYFVECQECGATIGNPDNEEFAIDSWNNRVKENYNQLDIQVGDKRFCVINDYPQYTVKEGICKKISKHNDNSTKYTFKTNNYKTYTFVSSSFGKKVFSDLELAQNAADKLNN